MANSSDISDLYLKYMLFEENFDVREKKEWLIEHWYYSFFYAATYACVVYAGKKLMEDRKKYQLTRLLFVWNVLLAIFSATVSIRGFPVAKMLILENDVAWTVCRVGAEVHDSNRVFAFWGYAMAMSKLFELGDTAFIVLRKQPLTFLHVFHHVTVLVYTWYSYSTLSSSGLIFGLVNAIVHACMYSYFALKSIKVKIPRPVSIVITIMQIMQMVLGCFVNYTAYQVLSRGENCNITIQNITYSVLMYFSYLLLFANFFWRSYITGTPLSQYYRNSDKKQS